MINEEISKEAGQAAQTIITYTIKAAKAKMEAEKKRQKKKQQYDKILKKCSKR